MIRSRITKAYAEVRKRWDEAPKEISGTMIVKFGRRSILFDSGSITTKVSRETDVSIQWAIPSYSDTVTGDSGNLEKPKGEAICCS